MAPSQQFRESISQLQATGKDQARQRLYQAVQAYEQAKEALSITKVPLLYAVSKTMLYNSINGRREQVLHIILKQ